MEFRNWLIRNLSISGGVIALLIIAVLLAGNDLSRRADKIQNSRQELSVRLKSFNSLVALRANASEAAKITSVLQLALPAKDQLIGFSKVLEGYAKNNKLGFGFSFESETKAAEKIPATNSFTLTSSGPYSQFIRFLRALEGGAYSVGFDSFDLNRRAGEDFDILIKGKVFSQ